MKESSLKTLTDGVKLGLFLLSAILLGALITVTVRLSQHVETLLDEATETVIESRSVILRSDALLAESQKSIQALREHADRDLIVIGAAATTVEKASRAQRVYWENYGAQVARTIDGVNALVADTNESLNRKLLPATLVTIEDTHAIALAAARSIDETNASLKPVLENAALLSGNAARALGDPAISESLRNIDTATASLAGAAADTHEATSIGLEAAKKMLAPASFAKKVLYGAAGVLGKFFGWGS